MKDELRPKYLNDLVGLTNLKSCLAIAVDAAKTQNRALENIFLEARGGMGKTSVAYVLANEIGREATIINCANLKDPKSLYKPLLTAQDRDIIFFDEIHALDKKLQEITYHAIEDNLLVIPKEKETLKIQLNDFTTLAATTDSGKITQSLRDRFAYQFVLDDYTIDDMMKLCDLNSKTLNINLPIECKEYVAKMSKNVPRILNNRLKWLRDYKISKNIPRLSLNDIKTAFTLYGLDSDGYSQQERDYIQLIKDQGPIGIKHISEMLGIGAGYIQAHIESHLIRDGVIIKTPNGRVHKDDFNKDEITKLLDQFS